MAVHGPRDMRCDTVKLGSMERLGDDAGNALEFMEMMNSRSMERNTGRF